MARRTEKAAGTFHSGHVRQPCVLRREIHVVCGIVTMGSQERGGCSDCGACRSLLDQKDMFQSFVHNGRALVRWRAIYPKPADTVYYDPTKQNKFLVKSVFDCEGNYLYYR